MKRIENYLLLDEIDIRDSPTPGSGLALDVRDATFSWPRDLGSSRDGVVLKDFSLQVKEGSSVGIVGKVGCGKSSFFSAILGDLKMLNGSAKVEQDIGYVPQKAFIVSGTLRHNIVMGRPFDRAQFDQVVRAACLTDDLKQLPGGEETEIGERGVTLSGGQQQRVAMARALYGKPKLLLMDDPLAAVDPHVAQSMFTAAVKERGDHKPTVIMALNQLQFVQHFDHLVHIVDGRVEDQGTFDECMARKGALSEYMGEHSVRKEAAKPREQVDSQEEAAVQAGQSLVVKEKTSTADTMATMRTYVANMGWRGPFAFFLCFLGYVVYSSLGLWLSTWVKESEEAFERGEDFDKNIEYGLIYTALCLGHVVIIIVSGSMQSSAAVRSGKNLHNECASRVLRAPVSWFESTPSGRLTSRFSSDVAMVDTQLAIYTEASFTFICTLLALATTVCIVVPAMVPVMVVAASVYTLLCAAVDRSNRAVRRMANMANGPVMGTLAEVSFGRGQTVVRSMRLSGMYAELLNTRLDHHSGLLFTSASLILWSTWVAYVIACTISSSTVLIMLNVGGYSPSQVGLAVAYAFVLPFFLQLLCVMLSLFWTMLTALERLLQCRGEEVPQEAAWELAEDSNLPQGWPGAGAIEFKNATLVYRPGLAPALREVSLSIPSQTSAGIVGRTGAGKSSLLVLLFRLNDVTSGEVLVDGVNVSSIGLRTLRRRMSIIPQEPLLMEGTVRTNVDPFNEATEEQVKAQLVRVGLSVDSMDMSVGRGATSLSAGQRQLVSLARTLLRDVRIVVLDEPTSNVDPVTDAQVQNALRTVFKGCTTVTIAHRLQTVLGCDQVVVMEAGQVKEAGPPADLLANPASALSGMVGTVVPPS